jgi:hypothetical protein
MYLHRRHSVVLALSAFRTIPFQDVTYHVILSRSKVLSTNSDNSESVTTSLHPPLAVSPSQVAKMAKKGMRRSLLQRCFHANPEFLIHSQCYSAENE